MLCSILNRHLPSGTPIEEWDISETSSDSVTASLHPHPELQDLYYLEISGAGSMRDFASSDFVPWSAYSDKILTVIVGGEVTYVGEYSFFGLSNLENIYILNPISEFAMRSDIVISSSALICAHVNSSAKIFSSISGHRFYSICEYENSTCLTCGNICSEHTGGEANCTEGAACEICGTEYTPSLGHELSNWHEQISSTCDIDGVKAYYECLRCRTYLDSEYAAIDSLTIPRGEHRKVIFTNKKAPGCTESGTYETYICTECERVFDVNNNLTDLISISPLGHIGGIADCDNRAICEKCGSEYGEFDHEKHLYADELFHDEASHFRKCTCGATADVAKHKLEKTIILQPTELADGKALYTCECGYIREETVPCLDDKDDHSSRLDNTAIAIIIAISVTAAAVLTVVIIKIIKRK